MKTKKALNEIVITVLAFAMLTFHTLTYLQNYYSFVVTLAVFALIVVLSFFKAKGMVSLEKNSSLVALGMMILIIVFIGYTFKKSDLTTMLGAYLPYIIWPILYLIVDRLYLFRVKFI